MRIAWSRSLALTSSSRWTGLPESRVSTNTMLMTTSMLSSVCSARPIRYRHMLALVPDVFPVVEPHVPRDQRPLADLRADAGDRVGGADRHGRDVLVEPRAHLVAHDPHAFLIVRLHREAIDELVELRVLDEEVQRGLRVAGAIDDFPRLRRHQRRRVGDAHARVRARPEVRREHGAIHRAALHLDADLLPVRRDLLADVRQEPAARPRGE